MKSALAQMVLLFQASSAMANMFGTPQSARPSSAPPAKPPPKTVTTYHLFERKYTGLAGKDAGDFTGDASFIFSTFNPFEKKNPEASMQENIIEMSSVTVQGWSTEYLPCNAPGAEYNSSLGKMLDCPSNKSDYCCLGNKSAITADTLPGYVGLVRGYWYSFPKASEGKMWTEKLERRINGACLGNVWRTEAGGCPQCGDYLDQCVANCIESNLVKAVGHYPNIRYDFSKLQAKWDEAFSNKTLCPDQPLPGQLDVIVV